jgi:hypothetical protein
MSNVLFALWMTLSGGMLVLFFYAAYLNWRNQRIHDVELGQIIPSFLPVDMAAFSELIQSLDDERLQQEGSSQEFAKRERETLRKAIDCLRRMTHNAALLQKLGYSQLHSPNELICKLAQEMIDAGVHVRLYSFIGLINLRLRSWFGFATRTALRPAFFEVSHVLSSSLIPAYELLKDKAGTLTCLKFSSLHQELVQSL